jgi:hypothetical protein
MERCINYVGEIKLTFAISANGFIASIWCWIINKPNIDVNDNIDIPLSSRENLDISILVTVFIYWNGSSCSKRMKIYISIQFLNYCKVTFPKSKYSWYWHLWAYINRNNSNSIIISVKWFFYTVEISKDFKNWNKFLCKHTALQGLADISRERHFQGIWLINI